MADEKLLKGVKSFLRSVLISSKDGVAAYNLQREYKEMVGEFLPFKKLGFPTLEDFIQSVPDVVELRWRMGELHYVVVPDEATAHIHELVSKQKSSKKLKKPARRPRGGGGSRFLPRGQSAGPQFSSGQFASAPRPKGPVRRRTLLPSPMVMPEFSHRPVGPQTGPPTPITVRVGNAATGSRTVRVGSKVNRLFMQAMTAANSERNEPKPGSGFEVPPRFRRKQESLPPPTEPSRRPGPKVTFPTVENGEMYMKVLTQHCRETHQGLKFDTIPGRLESATGYASSVQLNNVLYGSEDIYRTAKEAEEACAMVAVRQLGLLDAKKERKDSSKSEEKPTITNYPPEQIRIVKSRVKEILSNRRNGLWGTRVPFEYKEKYKEEPPPELMDMIRRWTDIARVELVETTGRDIIYPVLEDMSINRETVTKTNAESKTADRIEEKPRVMSKEKVESVVKDLIDLHKDTVKNQNEVLKTLIIPREELLNLEEEVTVFMTYIYNPGYFCVQREDSIIDELSVELQKYCQSRQAPSLDQLEKGQYCAGMYSGDDSWTRAEIIKVKDSPPGAELLFVDYGNIDTVGIELIRWLSPDTAKVPIQAANCSLYGIEPLETEDDWSSKASKEFAKLVKEEALIAVPKQVYDDIYDIELYLKSDSSVSINQKLVELGVVRTVAKPILEEEVDELNEPPQLVLPEGNQWDVYITFITSTNSVMLRLVGEDYSDKLEGYASTLEEAFQNSPEETPIIMGNLYIAYDDELYHRVRALSQEGKKVTCYFPDHGDTDWQIPDQLRPLDPEINKQLPYQAVEVSLYGLDDVATNVTALSKLCDLALANTCVVEVVERGDIPSVILYDTSQDEDININEAILQAVREDGGGIDTPRTLSPAPVSTSPTPRQVISPVQSSGDVRATSGSSQSLKGGDKNISQDSGIVQNSEKLGSSQGLKSGEGLVTQSVDMVQRQTAGELDSSQEVKPRQEFLEPVEDSHASLPGQISLQKVDNVSSESKLSNDSEIGNVPRFTESWTNPSPTNIEQNNSQKTDYNSNVSDKITGQTILDDNLTNTFDNLNITNQTEEVPFTTNLIGDVIENEPIKSVADNEQSKKEWSFDGRTIWNRAEYFKRPLPPNFEIPSVGEYLDIHINFIHDPSNFVCIPYAKMHELNQLLVDMIEYFHPTPPPLLKKDDIKLGHLYAGHKDGVWYRVKVKQFISDDLLSVCLVDIGEYSVLMMDELQPLPWTFWKLPLQAINAKLSLIQPVSGAWSEAAKYKFIELAREKDLIGLILEQDSQSGVVSFSLIDTSDSSLDLCIDEYLVRMGFATYC